MDVHHPPHPLVLSKLLLPLLALSLSACSRDERLAAFAERASAQQAHQNQVLAEHTSSVLRQGEQLAKAAEQLVVQDAQARRETAAAQAALHDQLLDSAAAIDRQREALAQERQRAEAAAARQPLIARAITDAALLAAALLPLVVTAYALARLPAASASDAWLLAGADDPRAWLADEAVCVSPLAGTSPPHPALAGPEPAAAA